MSFTREYFQQQGSLGGKKHNAKKSAQTMIEKYGPDYYKNLVAKRKTRAVKKASK